MCIQQTALGADTPRCDYAGSGGVRGEVSQWEPQGLFKEEGTQLRPGPVTRPSDPKDPPPPGAVRGEPWLIYDPLG